MSVRDNTTLGRFELEEKGLTVFANYRRHGQHVVIPHVEAAPQLRGTGAQMMLANTYHLALRPGESVVQSLGGLHEFSGWTGQPGTLTIGSPPAERKSQPR